MTEVAAPKPAPPAIPLRTWKIAAVIGMGSFMVMLDTTVANLAVESIRVDFSSTLAIIQWTITAYLIALAVSLPVSGWMCSRFGYGRVWALALLLFIASSVLCAIAPDPGTLIAGRALKGLAGGLLVPAGQAIVGATAHPRQLGRVVGTLGFAVALGPALGPAVGGAVMEAASWRWLFWFNLPVGLLALLLARGLIPPGEFRRERPLDLPGFFLMSTGLPLLLFGATETGAHGPSSLSVTAGLLGFALVAAFVLHSKQREHPLVDVGLFRRPGFLVGAMTASLTGANMYGGLLLIPLYLQLIVESSVAGAGLLLLVLGLGSAFALPLAGQLTDRFGGGRISSLGAAAVLLATLPFLLDSFFTTPPGAVLLGLLFFVRGFGLAWAQMPAMTAAYNAVDAEQMGDAAALVNIAQRIGGALGAVLMVMALNGEGSLVSAYEWAFECLTMLTVLTLCSSLTLRWVQGRSG